ncbi:ADP-ribosylglycohydrolase family protein [Streptomyces sp. ICN441]|uniref:ADP-ribosylglycohydrolase family protein n=1 Tax=Streptomyces sp. ICN441 TaxID=2558286 RepID=UPI001068DFD0|nr:ADP-ribosylglycohydrolase family protein [Streptomyces sp. ICN441]TFE56782.1 ADP-ribosylglycohydrolase family protein [Streptomyces sp. ICN441]
MNLRLTWVQPEDLVGHELRQAAEDGRDASAVAVRWRAAGGTPAPPASGASPRPAPPGLRALAIRLLDELDALPAPLADREPTSLPAIRAACPDWPESRPRGAPGRAGHGTEDRPQAGPGRTPEDRPRQDPRDGTHDRRRGTQAGTGDRDRVTPDGTHDRRWGTPDGTHDRQRGAPDGTDGRKRGAPGHGPGGPPERRLHAAWLGRAAGCLLGKPVEKLPLHAIRALARATGNWPLSTWFTAKGVPPGLLAAHPWNRRSAPTSLAENIDGMPEDDDLDYPLLNLLLLQRYGQGFGTADVARLWLDELPAGRTFTAERVAYRNLLQGVEPPATATRHNPFREWIGAAIRADVHGWTHPGDPAAAAEAAHRDAVLTHTANGVYGAMFVAAALAVAAGGAADVHMCLREGLRVVPPRSRLAGAVRHGIATAAAHRDFDTVVDRLHAAHGAYHWVHAVPNAALLAAALTHADGDFTGSICRAVSGGWDTDSNGATAGSLAGLLAGRPDRLPERWTAPLRNRLATTVGGFDGVGFDTLARLTCAHVTHREDACP